MKDEKNKKQCSMENMQKLVESIIEMPPSDTDPEGSYTGRPVDPLEKPIQDADDL